MQAVLDRLGRALSGTRSGSRDQSGPRSDRGLRRARSPEPRHSTNTPARSHDRREDPGAGNRAQAPRTGPTSRDRCSRWLSGIWLAALPRLLGTDQVGRALRELSSKPLASVPPSDIPQLTIHFGRSRKKPWEKLGKRGLILSPPVACTSTSPRISTARARRGLVRTSSTRNVTLGFSLQSRHFLVFSKKIPPTSRVSSSGL
jgi:hypothetical protein